MIGNLHSLSALCKKKDNIFVFCYSSSVRRSPNACKCNNFVSGYNYSIGIYNLSEDCSSSSQVLQIMNKNQRRTRGYGIIWIELNTVSILYLSFVIDSFNLVIKRMRNRA